MGARQKIQIRQVYSLDLMSTDLRLTHQNMIYPGFMITMNKGGYIFFLGVDGNEVIILQENLEGGTTNLCGTDKFGVGRKHMANTEIERCIEVSTKQKQMSLWDVGYIILELIPHLLMLLQEVGEISTRIPGLLVNDQDIMRSV